MRLHHVAIGTRNVEELARFYQLAFELTERRRFVFDDGSLRSIWLESGSVLLMVEHTEVGLTEFEGAGRGPFLLAFEIKPEERMEVEERLRSLGAPPESATEFTTYVRDPEGNKVAVSHYPNRAP